MKALVTGGAGFIGRWVVKGLLERGEDVYVLDNLSNGRESNLKEFKDTENFRGLVIGSVTDYKLASKLFENEFDVCFHLAASINVQESIDFPGATFENDVIGTFNILEGVRKYRTKLVFMSTCMVYNRAETNKAISEEHPTRPASPYAGMKLAGEDMVLSYHFAYGLPAVILRPFNTYGPFQKSTGEGGVIAIFIKNKIKGENLNIHGDGTQTRDFLYVEDCADFVIRAGYSEDANGQIINAGFGRDISIVELARMICEDRDRIVHVKHIHPQSEISKLIADPKKAKLILGWEPSIPLEEGIKLTEDWIRREQCPAQ